MYPRNAVFPPRIAVGVVYAKADNAKQTADILVAVRGPGDEVAGEGTISVGGITGVVYYTPTQGETNVESLTVVAYKADCSVAEKTIVTSVSPVAGTVDAWRARGRDVGDVGEGNTAWLLQSQDTGNDRIAREGVGTRTLADLATPANVTTARNEIISHGDGNWVTATGIPTPSSIYTYFVGDGREEVFQADVSHLDPSGGIHTQTVTVTSGASPVQNATVDILDVSIVDRQATNASGVALPSCGTGTYTLRVVRRGYETYTAEITVTGEHDWPVSLTAIYIAPPSDPALSRIRIYARLGGQAVRNQVIQVQQVGIPDGDEDTGHDDRVREFTTNAQGYSEFDVVRNAEHRWRYGRTGQWVDFTPTTPTASVQSDVGSK